MHQSSQPISTIVEEVANVGLREEEVTVVVITKVTKTMIIGREIKQNMIDIVK